MATYRETLDYLFSQLPMFSRIGTSALRNKLENTIELCSRLGDPHKKFKSIHIAGTNGKGSTSHMLAAILQTAGYKTGLYTSPHLKDFRERIRINGQMIDEQFVIDYVEANKSSFAEIDPSFFEMTVALAFDYFAKNKVDIAVIEVGLGGRLDSTNIITPLISTITNIGWDHMNILGDTLEKIAAEKAGIIKPGVPVVISERQPDIDKVFVDVAASNQSPIVFASDTWHAEVIGNSNLDRKIVSLTHADRMIDVEMDLTGSYQLKNIKGVMETVAALCKQGFSITDDHIKSALQQVKLLTGLHGRWEVIDSNPLTICDTGHNPDGIAEVLKNIEAVAHQQLHFVLGMVNDKDISKVLSMLPKTATYYFCRPDIPRGLNATELQQQAAAFNLHGQIYESVPMALATARNAAASDDLVFAGGSTFVVAELVK